MAEPTQVNYTQTSIPDYAKPYVETLLGQAQALTDIGQNPYMQYQGERVAQFSPLQQQAYENAALMRSAPQLQDASALAGTAATRALNTSYSFDPYAAKNVTADYSFDPYAARDVSAPTIGPAPTMTGASTGYTPTLEQYQMGPVQDVSTQSILSDPSTTSRYMSPYMQNVVDVQMQQAKRQADIAAQSQQAQAARAGAFGGGRDAIMRSQGSAELQRLLSGIQATGSQNAFQQAQSQFNTEQQRALQAAQGNQQTAYNVGAQNLGAQLGTQQLRTSTGLQTALANLNADQQARVQNQAAALQMQGLSAQQAMQAALANQQAAQSAASLNAQQNQYGAGLRLQAGTANQQAAQAAANLNAQQGQYGAGLGLQGLQTALTGARTLGDVGATQYQQNMGINQLQSQLGTQQQQQAQNVLNTQYQDFQNFQNYPYKQLGFMSDMLRGLPLTQQSSSIYAQQPTAISQLTGLGTAAMGIGKLAGMKEGGTVKSQSSGLADLAMMKIGA